MRRGKWKQKRKRDDAVGVVDEVYGNSLNETSVKADVMAVSGRRREIMNRTTSVGVAGL